MAAHQTTHQAVLQLFRPPDLRELITFAGKQLLAQCGHRKDVKQRAVGIKCQCLDVFELPGRLRHGRSCCQRCACNCYRGAGEFYEPSTIARHFSLPADLPPPFSQTTTDGRWRRVLRTFGLLNAGLLGSALFAPGARLLGNNPAVATFSLRQNTVISKTNATGNCWRERRRCPLGSKADISACIGHVRVRLECPLRANSGHRSPITRSPYWRRSQGLALRKVE